MKKFLSLILLIIISSFIIAQEYSELEVKANIVINKVQYKYENTSWKNVKIGDILHRGAIVQTGFKSKALFSIGESKILMRPLTKITIEQDILKDDSEIDISTFIDKGSTFNIINHTKKIDFTVRTPAAVASVCGTEFEIYANGQIKCYKGIVSVSKSDRKQSKIYSDNDFGKSVPEFNNKSKNIGPGEFTRIEKGNLISPEKISEPINDNSINLDPPDNKLEEHPVYQIREIKDHDKLTPPRDRSSEDRRHEPPYREPAIAPKDGPSGKPDK